MSEINEFNVTENVLDVWQLLSLIYIQQKIEK